MTSTATSFASVPAAGAGRGQRYAPFPRPAYLGLALVAAIAGFVATDPVEATRAIADAGPELTRLLRAMAALKTLFAAGAIAATAWRLGSAVTWPRLAAYALAGVAMSAGPGMIWGMAHVRLGALLLHGGLFATVVLLWRDRAMAERLAQVVAIRRARLGAGWQA